MHTIPTLTAITAQDDHMLSLLYATGETRLFDFKPYLSYPYYRELKNKALFRRVRIIDRHVEWATGQDFSPDTLYLKSTQSRKLVTPQCAP